MAIRKSELYSSLCPGCDELWGGMGAGQYKDYVLVMLLHKYIGDSWAGQPYTPIPIPEGFGFKDRVALKGRPNIGDQIDKRVVGPIAEATNCRICPTSMM